MIRVLVVDDQVLIRGAIAVMLGLPGDIDVVGQAATGREAVARARVLLPDVVVMDIRMPGLDGIAATAEICADAALAQTRVLILTTFENDANVVAALRAGASGFVGKGAEPEELVRAVRAVQAGDALLSPAATRNLIARVLHPAEGMPRHPATHPALLDGLTEREREVLRMVARGLSNQDIADHLVISIHTAKTHVNRVMTKLGAHDRAQLVIAGYESGLISPGE
ncbi:response regulator [Microbacterium sp.]|uniref:response regulator n=1 Tax=Microbacterium sp. TaxID=51671 RepID=UPI003C7578C4